MIFDLLFGMLLVLFVLCTQLRRGFRIKCRKGDLFVCIVFLYLNAPLKASVRINGRCGS